MINPNVTQAIEVISAHFYAKYNTPLKREEIEFTVKQFSPIYSLNQEEIDYVIKILETIHFTTMGIGVSLIDEDIPHDDEWHLKQDIAWSYWKDYQNLLSHQGLSFQVVRSIDNVTSNILGLLKNPTEAGEWERRGLVIGHVQSGKTANYIGLVTKAADAGYKFIIVIAGIHNSLRKQTQERVDQGFIGRDSITKQHIGVGKLRPNRSMPVTVTTVESDFNKSVAKRFGLELKSLNNTFILVIKKNVSTLSYLYNWLKELNTQGNLGKIEDIPMLMIDDEADNASINTNKEELDPTRTNRQIRNILNLFKKRCYVGYTATPFANIFIDPDQDDNLLGRDLFPEHFIHCLDAPTNYFGTEKLFLDDDQSEKFICKIDDAENHIPLTHKKDYSIKNLPPSLYEAITAFLLARAIRNLRGQENSHCSMMINVSRFVNVQNAVRDLVDIYIENLQSAIRFNYALPKNALKNHHIQSIYQTFDARFKNCEYSWEDVLAELNHAAENIRIIVVNSKSDQALDYSSYANSTTIAIGGFSLSRGLTIEGLTISYIYRNSKTYDTLMQMGRWFGYRDNYEDLCRIYMSDPAYGWYSHIAEATEELRMQIKQMRRERKKPSDFGLYVKAHPDTLLVTALNKMRYTEGREFSITYNGAQKDTYLAPSNSRKTDRNRVLLLEFFNLLSTKQTPFRESNNNDEQQGSYLFSNVNWETVQDFTYQFQYHEYWLERHQGLREYIQEVSDTCPKWDVIFQSLASKPAADGFMISTQERAIRHDEIGIPTKPPVETEDGWYISKKNRFSGNSMFQFGLNETQLKNAQNSAIENTRKKPIQKDFTNARGKPVLLIHLLTLVKKDEEANTSEIVLDNVPALSFSFVNFAQAKTVKYVVGPVLLKQLQLDLKYENEEDDFDLQY